MRYEKERLFVIGSEDCMMGSDITGSIKLICLRSPADNSITKLALTSDLYACVCACVCCLVNSQEAHEEAHLLGTWLVNYLSN